MTNQIAGGDRTHDVECQLTAVNGGKYFDRRILRVDNQNELYLFSGRMFRWHEIVSAVLLWQLPD